MSDCIAIAPELSFRQQISETLQHASRSLPVAEQPSARELMATFDVQLKPAEGETEASIEVKREIVRKVVTVYVETNGALEAPKESEAESSHILIQYVISTNFDTKSDEYASLVKSLLEAVRAGGEAAVQSGRQAKAEIASKILSNTYNFLAPESALRPVALLALISLLGASEDLASLPLSAPIITSALGQWSISEPEKIAFLSSAAAVYERAGDFALALVITLVALERTVDTALVQRAVALTLAQSDRFDLDDLLKIQGVQDSLSGQIADLVALFTTVDEIEAVAKATEWIAANGSFVEGLSVAGLDGEAVLRKVRLIALTTLAARSVTRQIQYSELAAALAIDESEVEAWVIDAIRVDLLQARLSQPLSLVRVQSVASRATRRFGSNEWGLLERRLAEWKVAVAEARSVVEEAEAIAAQGPITNQRRPQQQQQRRQEEEVAA